MKLRTAAVLLATATSVFAQNGSTISGPPWVHEEYTTSPPVYPSRKSYFSS